jgi:hypothetical protein
LMVDINFVHQGAKLVKTSVYVANGVNLFHNSFTS